MSGVSGRPSVTGVATTMTRVAPDAFRRAEAVRGVGLVLTGALSVLGGLLLATVAVALSVAIGLVGEGVGAFLPDLAVVAGLAGYLAAAPPAFARLTRATTAGPTAAWLGVACAGYLTCWWVLSV